MNGNVMPFSYKTILVPVDFSVNTEVAINKAIEVCDRNGAIHLLHVHPSAGSRQAAKKLQQWKESIEEYLDEAEVYCWMERSTSVQKMIEKTAADIRADLIVIGKNATHSWFYFLNKVVPSDIVKTTGCAVLTVKPGSLHNRVKTIVVPVAGDVPMHKLDAIGILCKRFKVKIHLVTFANGQNLPNESSTSSMLKTYQWLKDTLHCPVEYAVLHGHNKVKAALHYAEKVHADMLLVHPESETKIGWPNRHISDVLPAASKMQVLTVRSADTFIH